MFQTGLKVPSERSERIEYRQKLTTVIDRPWIKPFLEAMAVTPNVVGACRLAGVQRQAVYALRNTDPEFAAAWDEAIESAVDDLVADVWKRAKGENASDKLAMFLLQAHRRRVYGQKVEQEHSGQIKVVEVRYVDGVPPDPTAPPVSGNDPE